MVRDSVAWADGFDLIHDLNGACAGAALEILGDKSLPFTQAALSYGVLFVVFGVIMLSSRSGYHSKWYYYMLIGLVDAMAFCCFFYGMEFTSVTSMGVLACSGVIASIPLAFCFFRVRLNLMHYIGIGLTIGGIVLLVLSDRSKDSSSSHAFWGDLCILLGNSLYPLSAILMERALKVGVHFSEVMCLMSGFGGLFTLGMLGIVGEYKHFVPSTIKIGLLRTGSVLAEFVLYALGPAVLAWSGTTVLQLSYLSTAVWAVPVRMLFVGGFGSELWSFVLAAALTITGILLYITGGDVYAIRADKREDVVNTDTPDAGHEHEPFLPLQQPL